MALFNLSCPACGVGLIVELDSDVTPITCECGHTFLTQRPKAKPKKPKPKMPPLSLALLEQADDVTSSVVIHALKSSAEFKAFAREEMEGILARDEEDDQKLAEGIKMAVSKGAVPPTEELPLEPLQKIDVLGKSADAVAAEIVSALGDAPKHGCVLVLQGLSGTGKGTTVAKLQALLPRASTWSNGNVFRAITLLAVTYCESHGLPFDAEVLTPQLLAQFVSCLKFERQPSTAAGPPVFDVRIDGIGINARVSQVANTLLKEPKVSKNIPTVARVTQGEVISFAARCAEDMRAAGLNVLMEGRAQTLNYVRTPHRFELTLSKPLTIGLRRAAQRLVGMATPALKQAAEKGELTEAEVRAALEAALATLTSGGK